MCFILHTHSLIDANSETSEVASSDLPTLTEPQTKELEKVYINGQFQDAAVLRELSHRLELTDNQIQVRHRLSRGSRKGSKGHQSIGVCD